MPIINFNPPILRSNQQKLDLELERKNVGSCPLGVVGNLQFKAAQGGTPRASQMGVFFSSVKKSLINLCVELKYKLVRATEEEQARHSYLVQARNNSRHIGNLLGGLTAPAHNRKGWDRVAEALAKLAERSRGDLTELPGGRYCLSTYLGELSNADLQALRNGILSSPGAQVLVLHRVSPDDDKLRKQASQILNQVQMELDQRSAQTVQTLLLEIVKQLSDPSMSGQDLKKPLIRLAKEVPPAAGKAEDGSPLEDMLRSHFQSLPREHLQPLLTLVNEKTLVKGGLEALSELDDEVPYNTLEQIRDSLDALATAAQTIRVSESAFGMMG